MSEFSNNRNPEELTAESFRQYVAELTAASAALEVDADGREYVNGRLRLLHTFQEKTALLGIADRIEGQDYQVEGGKLVRVIFNPYEFSDSRTGEVSWMHPFVSYTQVPGQPMRLLTPGILRTEPDGTALSGEVILDSIRYIDSLAQGPVEPDGLARLQTVTEKMQDFLNGGMHARFGNHLEARRFEQWLDQAPHYPTPPGEGLIAA